MSRPNPIEPEERHQYWLAFEKCTYFKNPALIPPETAAKLLGVHIDDISDLEAEGILPRAGKKHKKGSVRFSLRRVVELRNDIEGLDRVVDAYKAATAAKNAKQTGNAPK